MKAAQEIVKMMADKIHTQAQERYNSCFDNEVYRRAAASLSQETACALQDDALALCGSPYHKISRRKWGMDARDFLRLFIQ